MTRTRRRKAPFAVTSASLSSETFAKRPFRRRHCALPMELAFEL